jgi:hypothetical protein
LGYIGLNKLIKINMLYFNFLNVIMNCKKGRKKEKEGGRGTGEEGGKKRRGEGEEEWGRRGGKKKIEGKKTMP